MMNKFLREALLDLDEYCEEIRKTNPPNADDLIYLAIEMYEYQCFVYEYYSKPHKIRSFLSQLWRKITT